MQNQSSLISSIHKSRQTIVDLMNVQGYDTSEYADMSITETNAKFSNDQLDMLFDKSKNQDGTIKKTYVNYYLGKSLRPAYVDDIIEDLFTVEELLTKNDTLYIIAKDDPHDTLLNKIKHLWEKSGIYVIIQNIKRLQFNILEHKLVPTTPL